MRRRDLYPLACRVTAAGAAAALLFAVSGPSAQPLAPGGPGLSSRVGPSLMGSSDDELSPRLYLGPNGEVFRLWLRAGDTQRGGSAVLLAVAKPENKWETVLDIRPSEKGTSYRDPYLAVGPPNRLAVLYRQKSNQSATKHIYLARSDDGGKNWTHSSIPSDTSSRGFEPEAVWARDGSLVVVWSEERRGHRLFDVYARRSPDGGKTWDREQLVSRFPRELPSDLNARPMLRGDGQDRLWTVWVGVRSAQSALYLARSMDGGRTWTEPQSLTGDGQSVLAQSFLRTGKNLLLLWLDTRTGQDRAYAVSSLDDGVIWSSPTRVDHLPADSKAQVDSVAGLLASDGEALAAWKDGRNGRTDIFLARSTDGGRTWGSEDRRLDTDEPGTAVSGEPTFARASDGRVAVAWDDDRAGYEGIYLRVRSAGPAQDWGPEMNIAAPAQKRSMRIPQLLWESGGQLYAAWETWDYSRGPSAVTKRVDSRVIDVGKP